MPTNSTIYGLRLPTDPDDPTLPDAMKNYSDDLEPVLQRISGSATQALSESQELNTDMSRMELQQSMTSKAIPLTGVSRYAIAFADSEGNEAGGFTESAVFDLAKPMTVMGQVAVTEPANSDEWAFAVVDSSGSVGFGVRRDGSVFPSGSGGAFSGNLSKLASDIAGLTRSKTTAVTAIGDSLTYGFFDGQAQGRDNWVDHFKTLADATVTNAAMSGYTVDEAGIRASFIQPLITVTGGSIPASGDVAITVKNAQNYDWENRTGATATVNIVGSLAGVPGRFKRNSDATFTFSRTGTGAVTPVPDDTPFIGEFPNHWDETLVIFLGRNNVARTAYGNAAGSVPAQVLASVKKILDTASVGVKQALIISVTTGSWETEGTVGYQTVQEINDLLATEYPTRFFDLRSYLVKQAIYDLGLTPTSEDVTAMNGDTLPPSIMAFGADGVTRDGVHYSRDTAKLVGQQIFNQLSMRGWVSAK